MWDSLPAAFDALMELQEALEQTKSTDYFGNGTASAGGTPPINFFEKGGDFLAVAELPGVKKEDLKIEIKKDLLRIAGERQIHYGGEMSSHRTERRSFRFDRTVKLPFMVHEDQVKAEYKDGLLAISLPRAESDKPKKIEIN